MTASAYLIVAYLASTMGSWQFMPYQFPGGMDACNKAVSAGKLDVAKGGDAEGAIAIFCSETEWPKTWRASTNTGWQIRDYEPPKK